MDARLFRLPELWVAITAPGIGSCSILDSLRASVARAGLRVDTLQLTQGAPFWSVSLFHVQERRRLVNRKPNQAIHQHPVYRLLILVTAIVRLVCCPLRHDVADVRGALGVATSTFRC